MRACEVDNIITESACLCGNETTACEVNSGCVKDPSGVPVCMRTYCAFSYDLTEPCFCRLGSIMEDKTNSAYASVDKVCIMYFDADLNDYYALAPKCRETTGEACACYFSYEGLKYTFANVDYYCVPNTNKPGCDMLLSNCPPGTDTTIDQCVCSVTDGILYICEFLDSCVQFTDIPRVCTLKKCEKNRLNTDPCICFVVDDQLNPYIGVQPNYVCIGTATTGEVIYVCEEGQIGICACNQNPDYVKTPETHACFPATQTTPSETLKLCDVDKSNVEVCACPKTAVNPKISVKCAALNACAVNGDAVQCAAICEQDVVTKNCACKTTPASTETQRNVAYLATGACVSLDPQDPLTPFEAVKICDLNEAGPCACQVKQNETGVLYTAETAFCMEIPGQTERSVVKKCLPNQIGVCACPTLLSAENYLVFTTADHACVESEQTQHVLKLCDESKYVLAECACKAHASATTAGQCATGNGCIPGKEGYVACVPKCVVNTLKEQNCACLLSPTLYDHYYDVARVSAQQACVAVSTAENTVFKVVSQVCELNKPSGECLCKTNAVKPDATQEELLSVRYTSAKQICLLNEETQLYEPITLCTEQSDGYQCACPTTSTGSNVEYITCDAGQQCVPDPFNIEYNICKGACSVNKPLDHAICACGSVNCYLDYCAMVENNQFACINACDLSSTVYSAQCWCEGTASAGYLCKPGYVCAKDGAVSLQCHTSCATCTWSNDASRCTACAEGYGPVMSTESWFQCAKCSDNCEKCTESHASCQSCKSGYNLTNYTCTRDNTTTIIAIVVPIVILVVVAVALAVFFVLKKKRQTPIYNNTHRAPKYAKQVKVAKAQSQEYDDIMENDSDGAEALPY